MNTAVRRVSGARLAAGLLVAALAAALGGCGSAADAGPPPWHDGRLYVATGNTTGVFYVLGGGYADLITRHLPGYEARAEPTNASVENIKRIDSGDMELGLTLADAAADGVAGKGGFDRPQKVVALARIYNNVTHVLVRNSAKIRTFADLRGKRVSTGSAGSGTDALATRMLAAGGLDPDRDIARTRSSLADTTAAMKANQLDALFWSGGLPTPGIAELMTSLPDQFTFLPLGDLVAPLNNRHGEIYAEHRLPKSVYKTPTDVTTLVTPNLLIAAADMPEQLAYDLTKLLFERQPELAKVHAEGGNFTRESARATGAVPLHPGAQRYFGEAGVGTTPRTPSPTN